MKKQFSKIYLPWLQIDNNIYSFMSGIFVSLATNIFTTLCFEEYNWTNQWHYYLSTIMFLIASAICFYLATKLNGVQNYINNNPRIRPEDRKELLLEVTKKNKARWFFIFFVLFVSVILGIFFLSYSYLANLTPLPNNNYQETTF